VADQKQLDAVVEELAALTNRNVSLDDVFGRVLAYSTRIPTMDRARINSVLMKSLSPEAVALESQSRQSLRHHPFILEGDEEKGYLTRICVPLVTRGLRVGYLWILCASTQDDPEKILRTVQDARSLMDGFAHQVAEAVEDDLAGSIEDEHVLMAALAGRDSVLRRSVAAATTVEMTGAVIAVLASPLLLAAPAHYDRTRLCRQATIDALRVIPATVPYFARPDHAAVLLPASTSTADLEQVQDRFYRALQLRGSDIAAGPTAERALIGVSNATHALSELPLMYKQAIATVQARSVDDLRALTLRYSSLGVYQFLAQDGRTEVEPRSTILDALLGATNGPMLVDMLESIYDSDAPRQDLAASLHIHRTSLYHRLQRIATITGEDPLSSFTRLTLHLALKARRWRERPRFSDLPDHLARRNADDGVLLLAGRGWKSAP
jgi:PucR family transcriptional regulator, proline-responsive transcriptional activator